MVRECMDGPDIPLSLVAHEGPDFHGCAHLIASDLDERPHYTPWIAAVEEGFSRGFDTVYLCAEPHLAPFYEKMGWRCIEEGVAGLSVFSISR